MVYAAGGNRQLLRPGRVASAAARHATRVPAGHPEGYLEAFAQLYLDATLTIRALQAGEAIPETARSLPTVSDGVAGLASAEAVLRSHAAGAQWTSLEG